MHPYIDILNQYFEEAPIIGCCKLPAGLLDLLFCCYTQHHNLDTPKIKDRCHELNELLAQLSPEENDDVFTQVFAISNEYSKEAFKRGISEGLRLYHELLKCRTDL